MARLRYNGLTATLGADLLTADTTITFTAALTHAGGTNVPTIGSGDYIPLAILDATTNGLLEIVHLTAYTTGATTGTVTRAQESTTAADQPNGANVVNGLTAADATDFASGTAAGRVLLDSDTLGAAAASITFSSIPATHNHLELIVMGRGQGTTETTLRMLGRFNGDTTAANYARQIRLPSATTASDYSQASDASIGYLTAAGASPASAAGLSRILIPGYALTAFHKVALTQSYSGGINLLSETGMRWANTSAITSIELRDADGGQFAAGTSAWLYGLD